MVRICNLHVSNLWDNISRVLLWLATLYKIHWYNRRLTSYNAWWGRKYLSLNQFIQIYYTIWFRIRWNNSNFFLLLLLKQRQIILPFICVYKLSSAQLLTLDDIPWGKTLYVAHACQNVIDWLYKYLWKSKWTRFFCSVLLYDLVLVGFSWQEEWIWVSYVKE